MEEEEKGEGRKSSDARQGKEEGAVVCGVLLLFTRGSFLFRVMAVFIILTLNQPDKRLGT